MSFNITKQHCSGNQENSNTFRIPVSTTCTEWSTQYNQSLTAMNKNTKVKQKFFLPIYKTINPLFRISKRYIHARRYTLRPDFRTQLMEQLGNYLNWKNVNISHCSHI